MECSIEGCVKDVWARTLCGTHYRYHTRHGSLPPSPRLDITPEERFWASVRKSDGCWEWIGNKRRRGYGRIKVDGKDVIAHRFAYELLVGPISDGLHLDHLCRNTSCVRPEHLEPVTCGENIRRGETGKWQQPWSHCAKGHALDHDNVRMTPDGRRRCRQCYEDRLIALRARRRSAQGAA